MGAAYSELRPLGRELAIWEIHLRSTGKSPHTVKSYLHGVRALAAWLTDEDLPLDPDQITTSQLREFRPTCSCRRIRAVPASAPAPCAPATTR